MMLIIVAVYYRTLNSRHHWINYRHFYVFNCLKIKLLLKFQCEMYVESCIINVFLWKHFLVLNIGLNRTKEIHTCI